MNLEAIRQSTIHVMRDQTELALRVTTVVACCMELCDEVERLRGRLSALSAFEADMTRERADAQEEADERSREMRDEMRIEHDRQIDSDVHRAEADYLNPRN